MDRNSTHYAPAAVLVSGFVTPFGHFFVATVAAAATPATAATAALDGAVIATQGPRAGATDPLAWGRWRFPHDVVVLAGCEHGEAHRQVEAYFNGALVAFDLPLGLVGSELDRLVWDATRAVPYGRAVTYGELALEIGMPGRARAVGRAMRICPAPLLVPCHRVVGADARPHGDRESWERREQLRRFEVETVRRRTAQRGGVGVP